MWHVIARGYDALDRVLRTVCEYKSPWSGLYIRRLNSENFSIFHNASLYSFYLGQTPSRGHIVEDMAAMYVSASPSIRPHCLLNVNGSSWSRDRILFRIPLTFRFFWFQMNGLIHMFQNCTWGDHQDTQEFFISLFHPTFFSLYESLVRPFL